MDEPFGSLDEQTRRRLDFELLAVWEKAKKTVVFVTHSIEEAIALADRIVLFTTRPGAIQKEWNIDLPRPRDVLSSGISAIRKEILQNFMLCCPPESTALL
jgi:ABC-type nitrate/sulfonate/bicarbonate transport system ATPase subunit